jgi:hypothetical protein
MVFIAGHDFTGFEVFHKPMYQAQICSDNTDMSTFRVIPSFKKITEL